MVSPPSASPPPHTGSHEPRDCVDSDRSSKYPSKRAAWFVIVSILGVACLCLGGLVLALHFLQSAGPETLLSRHVSPSGQWVLTVRHEGPAFSARAPSRIGLYASPRSTSDETLLATLYVNNDGADLSRESCQVKWLHQDAEVAQVTCHGEEQSDDVWLANLSAGEAWQLSGD